jgi:transposase
VYLNATGPKLATRTWQATPMFLPCDLREWVPEGHIVHFILDAVEQIPTAHFQVNDRGTGSEQYPPTMTLALLAGQLQLC